MQILNSFGKGNVTQEDAGALYGFSAPIENACRKPGEWQVFDIRYRAPRRDEVARITENGTVSVWFNGKMVQDRAQFGEPKSAFHPFRFGTTPYLEKIRDRQKKTMIGPVFLQDHGNPVKFRNVWISPRTKTSSSTNLMENEHRGVRHDVEPVLPTNSLRSIGGRLKLLGSTIGSDTNPCCRPLRWPRDWRFSVAGMAMSTRSVRLTARRSGAIALAARSIRRPSSWAAASLSAVAMGVFMPLT